MDFALFMNKRLVWNFEIDTSNPLQSPGGAHDRSEEAHWELRYFWPENEVICLHGLNESFLDLAQFQIKKRVDTYFLSKDLVHNIKLRNGNIMYKPLISQTDDIYAYGAKIDVSPESDEKMHASIQTASSITVEKTALLYHFPVKPKVKMELARIGINNQVFFSLSVESRALSYVRELKNHLRIHKDATDYVSFLKMNFL